MCCSTATEGSEGTDAAQSVTERVAPVRMARMEGAGL